MVWMYLMAVIVPAHELPARRAADEGSSAQTRIMTGVETGSRIETEYPDRLYRRIEILPGGTVVRLVVVEFE